MTLSNTDDIKLADTIAADDENIPLPLSLSEKQRIILEKRALSQEKISQQEIWRKLVVKIISWSDGLLSGGIIKKTDKISKEEWEVYYSRTLKININGNKQKVEDDLEDTRKKITSFGGFEDTK